MPRVSRQKPKGDAQMTPKGGIQTSPKNVAATVQSLKRGVEIHQAAYKHLVKLRKQKKGTEEARVGLAIANSKLEEERLDAEAILRRAERSGMQTAALKEAIELASDALSKVMEAPKEVNPPNPKPSQKASDVPNLETVVEEGEEEEATVSTPILAIDQDPDEFQSDDSGEVDKSNTSKNKTNSLSKSKAARSNPGSMENPDKDEDTEKENKRTRMGTRSKGQSEVRAENSNTSKKRSGPNPVDDSGNENEAVDSELTTSGSKVNDPPRKIKSKSSGAARPKLNLDESLEVEEEDRIRAKKTPPGKKSRDIPHKPSRSKRNTESVCSGCSNRSKAETDLNNAELSKKAIQNNIESLKAQLRAQELALKNQSENVSLHRARVANEKDQHSQSGCSSEELRDIRDPDQQSPTRKRIDDWVDKSRKRTKPTRNDAGTAMDELSSAAAAVLRHQLLQSQKPSGFSVLEGVKIMERRRPSEKFTGEDSKIDFEDHVAQFRQAVDIPNLPASFKLAELKEWFGGLARVHIARFMRREDHEEALEEAMLKLQSEHGSKATTAEEMIEDILSGKTLEARDAVGINTAISKLEEAYFLAVETGRDADFNRKSLFRNVLTSLFPYLKIKWASEVAKAQALGKSLDKFEDFLRFLTVQKRVASEMQKLSVESEKSEKPTKTSKKPSQKEGKNEDGVPKVEKKTRKPRSNESKKPEAGECSLCEGENHWLHECKRFADMNVEDRWEYCEERSVCPKCLRAGHRIDECTFRAKCRSCGGSHNTLVHGAKCLPVELKHPTEVEKQA